MNAVQEIAEKLQALRKEWKTLYDANAEKMDHSEETVARLQELNTEMTDLGKELDKKQALQQIDLDVERGIKSWNTPVDNIGFGMPGDMPGAKSQEGPFVSPGEYFIASEQYKKWSKGSANQHAAVEVPGRGVATIIKGLRESKATFTIAGATLTQEQRIPKIVMVGTERLTVADLLAQGQTTGNRILYPKEDTFTNAATTVAEGDPKPEATFDTSEGEAPVRKIAVFAKVTDELYEDFPALRDYIDERLPFMVRITEEAQLLNGNGTAPNLRGLMQTSGVQTYTKDAAEEVADAIYEGITKVRFTGFFEPSGVVFHPNNWKTVRLMKTTDGIYIWGSPSEAGPERIWGLPVVVTTSMTENTALVGSYKLGAQVFYKGGMRIESTNANEDDFKKNLIAIRAEIREALAVYRPAAFCKVVSLNN